MIYLLVLMVFVFLIVVGMFIFVVFKIVLVFVDFGQEFFILIKVLIVSSELL